MVNQYTLKVYPQGRGREVYRVITLTGDHTLDFLCSAILDAFDFDNDHLYEFCMDNRPYSDHSYQFDPEGFDDCELSTNVTLDEIGLCKKQKFLLHYDFGDDWMFPITVQEITRVPKTTGAHVIREKGIIHQYPY